MPSPSEPPTPEPTDSATAGVAWSESAQTMAAQLVKAMRSGEDILLPLQAFMTEGYRNTESAAVSTGFMLKLFEGQDAKLAELMEPSDLLRELAVAQDTLCRRVLVLWMTANERGKVLRTATQLMQLPDRYSNAVTRRWLPSLAQALAVQRPQLAAEVLELAESEPDIPAATIKLTRLTIALGRHLNSRPLGVKSFWTAHWWHGPESECWQSREAHAAVADVQKSLPDAELLALLESRVPPGLWTLCQSEAPDAHLPPEADDESPLALPTRLLLKSDTGAQTLRPRLSPLLDLEPLRQVSSPVRATPQSPSKRRSVVGIAAAAVLLVGLSVALGSLLMPGPKLGTDLGFATDHKPAREKRTVPAAPHAPDKISVSEASTLPKPLPTPVPEPAKRPVPPRPPQPEIVAKPVAISAYDRWAMAKSAEYAQRFPTLVNLHVKVASLPWERTWTLVQGEDPAVASTALHQALIDWLVIDPPLNPETQVRVFQRFFREASPDHVEQLLGPLLAQSPPHGNSVRKALRQWLARPRSDIPQAQRERFAKLAN